MSLVAKSQCKKSISKLNHVELTAKMRVYIESTRRTHHDDTLWFEGTLCGTLTAQPQQTSTTSEYSLLKIHNIAKYLAKNCLRR